MCTALSDRVCSSLQALFPRNTYPDCCCCHWFWCDWCIFGFVAFGFTPLRPQQLSGILWGQKMRFDRWLKIGQREQRGHVFTQFVLLLAANEMRWRWCMQRAAGVCLSVCSYSFFSFHFVIAVMATFMSFRGSSRCYRMSNSVEMPFLVFSEEFSWINWTIL